MRQLTYNEIIKIIIEIETSFSNDSRTGEIDENTNLIDSGIIDSLMMVELVSNLEDEYGIEIDVDDLIPDNFKTVVSIYNVCIRSRKK